MPAISFPIYRGTCPSRTSTRTSSSAAAPPVDVRVRAPQAGARCSRSGSGPWRTWVQQTQFRRGECTSPTRRSQRERSRGRGDVVAVGGRGHAVAAAGAQPGALPHRGHRLRITNSPFPDETEDLDVRSDSSFDAFISKFSAWVGASRIGTRQAGRRLMSCMALHRRWRSHRRRAGPLAASSTRSLPSRTKLCCLLASKNQPFNQDAEECMASTSASGSSKESNRSWPLTCVNYCQSVPVPPTSAGWSSVTDDNMPFPVAYDILD
ncbi:hypothetical protein U9M48_021927 [Paspalum notatum var. saurae]|uniref:Uncharacterized protein n=1 Tax=Paspalum notatum var. saurae TaxID=547442 RepID=A0AAQ3TK24_PASNO